MEFIYCGLIGYLIGTVNPSYLMAKKRGFDIRTKGSGNAGASNALILFGKAIGVVCALLDIAKAYLAVYLTRRLFPDFEYAFAVTSASCIMGHVFPWYMKFKGGKGLACLGGVILFFDPVVFLIMLSVAVVIALIADYICVVPVAAAITFPIIYGCMEADFVGACILAVVAVAIVIKHIENFRRIANGTEIHLSYLWKPKAEVDRLKATLNKTDAEVEDHFSVTKK